MLENRTEQKLKHLELLLRDQLLTPAKTVDNDTLLCLTEMMPDGTLSYHQMYYTALPTMLQEVFLGQPKDTRHGPFKLIALFSIWDLGYGFIPITKG